MERNQELEQELENELAHELTAEGESQHEAAHELERAYEGELASELEGELSPELEGEAELEAESAHEALELEGESEAEGELGQHEQEQFFGGRLFRGIGRFVRSAAPLLKRVGQIAAPLVGKAVGGFFGPAGTALGAKVGQFAGAQLGELEAELEAEMGEHEHESHEYEAEGEAHEHELESELHEHEAHEAAEHEQLAELIAHEAARSATEAESEALIGAATTITLSPRDRAALRRLVPHLVRGAAILTRILRTRRTTRPMIRAVPLIVRSTTRILRRGALQGIPITRQRAGRVMAIQTRRVLSSPRLCVHVLKRNARLVGRGATAVRSGARTSNRWREI